MQSREKTANIDKIESSQLVPIKRQTNFVRLQMQILKIDVCSSVHKLHSEKYTSGRESAM